MVYKIILIEELKFNFFILIGNEWMFIIVGNINFFNIMIVSWGSLGYMWVRFIVFCVIRL